MVERRQARSASAWLADDARARARGAPVRETAAAAGRGAPGRVCVALLLRQRRAAQRKGGTVAGPAPPLLLPTLRANTATLGPGGPGVKPALPAPDAAGAALRPLDATAPLAAEIGRASCRGR